MSKVFKTLRMYRLGQCLIASLLLLLLFSSCNNLFENPSEKNHNTSERKYITVTGSLNLDGAFPAEFIQMYQRQAELVSASPDSADARTAFPSIPTSGLTYVVKAVYKDDTSVFYSGTPSADNTSYTVAIPVQSEPKDYYIEIKVKHSLAYENEYCILSGKSDNFTIEVENPVVTKNITLKANPTGESGILDLNINVTGSGIASARATIKFSAISTTTISNNTSVDGIINIQTGEFTEDELADGISSGAYPATFDFYSGTNCSGEKVYSFTEIINVFANLTTNTWVQNGNEPWFVTTTDAGGNKSTTCRITAAMVEGYALKDIYVDSTRNTTNPSDSTYTTQSGTFFNPVTSFDAALAMLHDAGKDYTIYIMGEINGGEINRTCTIPDTLKKTGSGGSYTYARSLTLRGYTGLSEGVPQDSINGGYTENDNGHTLKILTEVPVIIQNLKITGGYSASNVTGGGGIFSTGDLTLDSGALVTGNYSKSCGGGVYNDGGILRIKRGAVISDNHEVAAVNNCGGGGVFNNNGTLIMSGGTIKANTAAHDGGGIYISSSNASVTLTDGVVITGNQATCGGGVFLDQGNLFVYGSAVIGKSGVSSHATSADYGNKATTSGGGIGVGTGTLWLGYSGENIPAETSGGVIYNLVMGDSETHGGGIDNRNGTVNIARGNVSYNYACCSSGSTATGCGGGISTARTLNLTGTAVIEENYSSYGGGVYITKDSNNGHLIMTGGTIRLNHVEKERPLITSDSWGDGGGVAIGSNASFTISGGTISSNYAERYGGAVVDHFGTAFNIKGSAYIPYDSVHSCNDVYIASGKTIALSESLSPPDGTDGIIASITPKDYTEATPVFTISAPATSAELSHFKVIPYNGVQEWIITTEGKLKEGVDLPSSSSSMVSGNTYLVSGSSGIGTIAEFSSSGYDFSGVKLKLESNVIINTDWTPIGDSTAFSGTFDGNGKTVTFDSGAVAEAFFGTVNGNVKNLKVVGSASVAGIAKTANSSSVIENCESSATITSSTAQEYCAGIVAVVESGATIKGCVNKGTITSNVNLPQDNYTYGAGGITGRVDSTAIIDSCVNTGNVTGPTAGGIAAEMDWKGVIRNASNSGNVTSTGVYAGGIVGAAIGNGGEIENACHIYNCFNSGDVTAAGTQYRVYAGGITGKLGWGNGAWAHNCLNIGSVSLGESAQLGSVRAALFGEEDSYSRIDFCYYKEGCAGTAKGVGGSSSDTANECIKATQSGTNNAVISVDVTLDGTTYSADTGTVLSLLNAWVTENNTGGLYLVWESATNHWPKLKTE